MYINSTATSCVISAVETDLNKLGLRAHGVVISRTRERTTQIRDLAGCFVDGDDITENTIQT